MTPSENQNQLGQDLWKHNSDIGGKAEGVWGNELVSFGVMRLPGSCTSSKMVPVYTNISNEYLKMYSADVTFNIHIS